MCRFAQLRSRFERPEVVRKGESVWQGAKSNLNSRRDIRRICVYPLDCFSLLRHHICQLRENTSKLGDGRFDGLDSGRPGLDIVVLSSARDFVVCKYALSHSPILDCERGDCSRWKGEEVKSEQIHSRSARPAASAHNRLDHLLRRSRPDHHRDLTPKSLSNWGRRVVPWLCLFGRTGNLRRGRWVGKRVRSLELAENLERQRRNILFAGGGTEAFDVVCMNCSVRSLLAFIFCRQQLDRQFNLGCRSLIVSPPPNTSFLPHSSPTSVPSCCAHMRCTPTQPLTPPTQLHFSTPTAHTRRPTPKHTLLDTQNTALLTHLRSQLQNIFEPHPHIRQPALKEHDNVRIMFIHHACSAFRRRLPALFLRPDVGLQRGDLGVERGDILADNVGEFGDFNGAVVEQRLPLGHCVLRCNEGERAVDSIVQLV